MTKGHWIYGENEIGHDGYFCSECGCFVKWDYTDDDINFIGRYSYCPYCSTDMREGGEQG